MKKIIIIGAGDIGKRAFNFWGSEYVEYFADNYKEGTSYCGKEVISINGLVLQKKKYILLLAVSNYLEVIRKQLEALGINDYFYFQEEIYYGNCLNLFDSKNYYVKRTLYEIVSENKMENAAIIGTNGEVGKLVASLLDLPVYSIEELQIAKKKHQIFLINELDRTLQKSAYELLKGKSRNIFIFIGLNERFRKEYPQLAKFKGCHSGDRCFIIGNGPSLCVQDLEVLYKNGEICCGLNVIHKLYDKTNWRADYICVSDVLVIMQNYQDIIKYNQCPKFISDMRIIYHPHEEDSDEYLFRELHISKDKELTPDFSQDITKGIYNGSTVAYIALQICIYMGFNEIYLLGMDCSDWGNHFSDGYWRKKEVFNRPNEVRIFKGYREIERISREMGIRIYNATRGGKLEAFERVNFDKLFSGR